MCNAYAKEQAGTRKSTDQDGNDWSVKVSRGDRCGDRESDGATNESTRAALG
jgi:hypothetical protein